MTKNPDSAECPMCGRSVPSDASSCPGCGADLSMSSLEELEKVAKSLSTGEPMPSQEKPEEKVEEKAAPVEAEAPKAQKEAPKQMAEEAPKQSNRFGKLFGKRKK